MEILVSLLIIIALLVLMQHYRSKVEKMREIIADQDMTIKQLKLDAVNAKLNEHNVKIKELESAAEGD